MREGPAALAPGEHWTYLCGAPGCIIRTQGGLAGLRAHRLVVHEMM